METKAFDSVHLLGMRKNVADILQSIDVFVLPSLNEGISNTILEAMAAGLAIVTTSIPANKELIENNHSGLLVQARDSVEMADAIQRLLNSPDLARKLGENALQRATNDFSINTMTSKYEEFYFTISGKGA